MTPGPTEPKNEDTPKGSNADDSGPKDINDTIVGSDQGTTDLNESTQPRQQQNKTSEVDEKDKNDKRKPSAENGIKSLEEKWKTSHGKENRFDEKPFGDKKQDDGRKDTKPACHVEKLAERNRRLFKESTDNAFEAIRPHSPSMPPHDLSILISRDARVAAAILAGCFADAIDDCFWMDPPRATPGEVPPKWVRLLTAIKDSIEPVGHTPVLIVEAPVQQNTVRRFFDPDALQAWAREHKVRLIVVLTGPKALDTVKNEKLPKPLKGWDDAEPLFLEAYANALRAQVSAGGPLESLVNQIRRGLWGEDDDISEVLDRLQSDLTDFEECLTERSDQQSRSARAQELEQLVDNHVTRWSPAHAIVLFFAGYFPNIREHTFSQLANRIVARLPVKTTEVKEITAERSGPEPLEINDHILRECRLAVRQAYGGAATLQPHDGIWVSGELKRLFARQGRQARRKILEALLLANPLGVLDANEQSSLADLLADELVAGELIGKPDGADLVLRVAFAAPVLGGRLSADVGPDGWGRADAVAARVKVLAELISSTERLASAGDGRSVVTFVFAALIRASGPDDATWRDLLHAVCARTLIGLVFAAPGFSAAMCWGQEACRVLARHGNAVHVHAAVEEISQAMLAGGSTIAGVLTGFAEAAWQAPAASHLQQLAQGMFWSLQLRLFLSEGGPSSGAIDLAAMIKDLTEDDIGAFRGKVVRLALSPSFRQRFENYYPALLQSASMLAPSGIADEVAQDLDVSPKEVWAALALRETVFGLLSALFGPGNVNLAWRAFDAWLEDVLAVPVDLRLALPLLWLRDHPFRKDEDVQAVFSPADDAIDAFIASAPLLIATSAHTGHDTPVRIDAELIPEIDEKEVWRETRAYARSAVRTLLDERARAAGVIRYSLRGDKKASASKQLQEMKRLLSDMAAAIRDANAAPSQESR